MFTDLGTVLIFTLVAIVFVILNVSVLSRLLRPSLPDPAKTSLARTPRLAWNL